MYGIATVSSVYLSVCNVEEPWSYKFSFFENNYMIN